MASLPPLNSSALILLTPETLPSFKNDIAFLTSPRDVLSSMGGSVSAICDPASSHVGLPYPLLDADLTLFTQRTKSTINGSSDLEHWRQVRGTALLIIPVKLG